MDLIKSELEKCNMKFDFYSLPAKKWPWRARCSALYFSQIIKRNHSYKILFSSSVLNLCELISLRKDLSGLKKVIYFHENQLCYPVRNQDNKERDFQFGYNQILTSLVADKLVFNSNYNKTSFLNSINSHLKLIPDNRPKIDTKAELEPKCDVLYFPVNLDLHFINSISVKSCMDDHLNYLDFDKYSKRPLHICWPHRWEHDKNPSEFFNALFRLHEMNIDFRLSVLGEMYSEIPEIFNIAKQKLASKIVNWGYLHSKEEYYNVLSKCDIVVSTSQHEFFGVAVIEACLFGCYPILPNRLVYPELYSKDCLYSTEAQLVKKLKFFCSRPDSFRKTKTEIFNTSNKFIKNNNKDNKTKMFSDNFLWSFMKHYYIDLFK